MPVSCERDRTTSETDASRRGNAAANDCSPRPHRERLGGLPAMPFGSTSQRGGTRVTGSRPIGTATPIPGWSRAHVAAVATLARSTPTKATKCQGAAVRRPSQPHHTSMPNGIGRPARAEGAVALTDRCGVRPLGCGGSPGLHAGRGQGPDDEDVDRDHQDRPERRVGQPGEVDQS